MGLPKSTSLGMISSEVVVAMSLLVAAPAKLERLLTVKAEAYLGCTRICKAAARGGATILMVKAFNGWKITVGGGGVSNGLTLQKVDLEKIMT